MQSINPNLSFSLLPPLNGNAGVTTIGALKSTGILNVVNDKPNHIVITPKYDTMENWYRIGSVHPCTVAIKSKIRKWDGGFHGY